MPDRSCSIREWTIRGYRAVALQNEHLDVVVLPQKGAEIYSITYRPREFDILWKAPWGLHKASAANSAQGGSEAAWMDGYGGGWQGIFPNGGDACVNAGASLSFHGEASISEWDFVCKVYERRASVSMQVRLARSPFFLTREVSIEEGALSVVVRESVVNEAEEAASAMWGHHPAFATDLVRGAGIETSARTYQPHAPEISPTGRIDSGSIQDWPLAASKTGTQIDLSQLPQRDERLSEMGYLSGFDTGQYRLVNKSLNLGVEVRWDCKVFPFLWSWLEWGASFGYPFYGRCRVFALEPFNSIPGSGLNNAIDGGTELVYAPGERRSTEVSMSILTDVGR